MKIGINAKGVKVNESDYALANDIISRYRAHRMQDIYIATAYHLSANYEKALCECMQFYLKSKSISELNDEIKLLCDIYTVELVYPFITNYMGDYDFIAVMCSERIMSNNKLPFFNITTIESLVMLLSVINKSFHVLDYISSVRIDKDKILADIPNANLVDKFIISEVVANNTIQTKILVDIALAVCSVPNKQKLGF
jgi:hypothetical protein